MSLLIAAIKTTGIFVSAATILAMVIVGGLGVWYYRRRVLFSEHSSTSDMWGFDDLRRMRDQGDLTEEEYQALRGALIGSFQGKAKTDSAPVPNDTEQGPHDAEA